MTKVDKSLNKNYKWNPNFMLWISRYLWGENLPEVVSCLAVNLQLPAPLSIFVYDPHSNRFSEKSCHGKIRKSFQFTIN